MEWFNVKDAPMDTPVLTDVGVCILSKSYGFFWYYCDTGGNTFACADNGPYEASPTIFAHLPEEMKG